MKGLCEALGAEAAAEIGGWPGRQPDRWPGTMDVVITGDGLIPTDIEVQHSPQEARLTRRRTLKYNAAGYLPVWFSDRRDRPSYLPDGAAGTWSRELCWRDSRAAAS